MPIKKYVNGFWVSMGGHVAHTFSIEQKGQCHVGGNSETESIPVMPCDQDFELREDSECASHSHEHEEVCPRFPGVYGTACSAVAI